MSAIIWNRLEAAVQDDLDPNLVRALLGNSATLPEAASNRIGPIEGDQGISRVCGYGLPDAELALESGDRRVTLIAQGSIALDTLILFEVPVPDVLRNAPGRKRTIASLAFDPPVRRRRAEYPGVEMGMNLFRGKTPDEIVAAYRSVSRDDAPGALRSPYQCDLLPQITSGRDQHAAAERMGVQPDGRRLWGYLLPHDSGQAKLGRPNSPHRTSASQ